MFQTNQCPYCDAILPSPLSKNLSNLLAKFKKKKLQAVEQFEFCRIHIAELEIVPEGLKKGYLATINFDDIPNRIEKFQQDLIDIYQKKEKSFFRDNIMRIFCETDVLKANTTMGIMNRFETFQVKFLYFIIYCFIFLFIYFQLQPGYYGPRGAIIIAETLRRLFIDTKKLTISLSSPQAPMHYLQEVLVPEAAVRLIQEDYNGISAEDARKIMFESLKFGEYVHNDEILEI